MPDIYSMTIGEMAGWIAAGVAALSTVVQISPVKINPWTCLARKIGRAINGEVISKVDNLENNLNEMKKAQEERDAKEARTRILRFGDELIHDVHHTKEHFDDVLQDMTDYENYCASHPDFKNNRTHLTTQIIKETYHKCLEEHNFL